MNIDYKNEQFKKVNDNFNYIQKEFEEIFKIYFSKLIVFKFYKLLL